MTSLAIYLLVLSGAMSEDRPTMCRDRIAMAIESAPMFVDSRMTKAQAYEAAKNIAETPCNNGLMFVSSKNHQ